MQVEKQKRLHGLCPIVVLTINGRVTPSNYPNIFKSTFMAGMFYSKIYCK